MSSELTEAMDAYLRTLELDEARHAHADAPPLPEQRARLHAAWLAAARLAIDHSVSHAPRPSFEPSEAGAVLLDHAVFDHPWFTEAGVDASLDTPVEGVLRVHDALAEVSADLLRSENAHARSAELDSLMRDIELWPETHLAHVRYRDSHARLLLSDSPDAGRVLMLFGEIDERLEPLRKLESRPPAHLTPEERRELSSLRHEVAQREEAIKDVLHPVSQDAPPERVELIASCFAAQEAIDASIGHLLALHARRRGLERQILEDAAAARDVPRLTLVHAVRRELDSIMALTRLGGRYAGRLECAVPVDLEAQSILPDDAADAMDHILEFDPGLLSNAQATKFGAPDLLLAPGIGDGVYDGTRNRLVVPIRCPGGPVASLAHAAVLYRLEADTENRLLAAWRDEVPGNRGTRANLKLRSSLIRNYITWMTDEAFGIETLPRPVREWFEKHVAPPKDQPQVPRDLRAMDTTRLRRERTRMARESGPEADYRRAIIEWLLDDSVAAVSERAIPLLDSALKTAPNDAAALYSRAVLNLRLHRHRHAIDDFRAFTEATPRSWWSLKAIELCARCR